MFGYYSELVLPITDQNREWVCYPLNVELEVQVSERTTSPQMSDILCRILTVTSIRDLRKMSMILSYQLLSVCLDALLEIILE